MRARKISTVKPLVNGHLQTMDFVRYSELEILNNYIEWNEHTRLEDTFIKMRMFSSSTNTQKNPFNGHYCHLYIFLLNSGHLQIVNE